MITRHGLDTNKIHYGLILCVPSDIIIETWLDIVRCSYRIQDVTCEACIYYYMNPREADRPDKIR